MTPDDIKNRLRAAKTLPELVAAWEAVTPAWQALGEPFKTQVWNLKDDRKCPCFKASFMAQWEQDNATQPGADETAIMDALATEYNIDRRSAVVWANDALAGNIGVG